MQITDETFESDVLHSDRPVLVDFWASWCPPCKMMEPVVARLRDNVADRADVVAVNIDRNQQTAAAYRIDSVPTFAVFANGELIEKRTGALTVNQLRQLIDTGCAAVQTSATDADYVTIVSGLPRSGTSMMMKMLEAGGIEPLTDHHRNPDEDNPNGYYELEAVKSTAADPSWLDDANGRAVKMVYSLLRDLPDDRKYRVIFMRRNLDEVLDSQRRMLERHGKAPDVDDRKMKQLFQTELDRFTRWIADQPRFDVCDVDYNSLLQSPAESLEPVAEHLDDRVDTTAMADVVDPSLYRQRSLKTA